MEVGDSRGEWDPFDRSKVMRDLGDAAVREQVNADQMAYYRARAPWYDDVYTRTGHYDRGPELNAKWQADLAQIEARLAVADIHGECVELGAGTGYWTERVVGRVDRLWAIDASVEVLDIARARLGAMATRVEFVIADLWAWRPERMWDCAVACFFLEHVPDEVLPGLLGTLRTALRPGGCLFVAEGAPGTGSHPQVETRPAGDKVFQVVERRRTLHEFRQQFDSAGFSVDGRTGGRFIHFVATRQ